MRASLRLLAFLSAASLVLAGCVGTPEESTENEADAAGDDTHVIIADLPDGTTEVEVNITAWGMTDNATRVLVVVENTTREVLTQETFDVVGETTRLLRVDVDNEERVYVTVRVIEGAADLEVQVTALQDGQQPVVVVHERVEMRPDESGADSADGDAPSEPTPDDNADSSDDVGDDTVDDGATNETNDTNATSDTNTTNETNTTG